MKAKAVKTLIVLTVFALVIGVGSMGFSDFKFNQEQKEISGTITLKLPGGYYLKTSSGDEYRLMMGPRWFLEDIGLELKNKDRVSVKGFNDEDNAFLVTEITKGTKTYEIFDAKALSENDEYGCGRWDGGRHGMWDYHHRGMWGRRGDYDRGDYGRGYNQRGMM